MQQTWPDLSSLGNVTSVTGVAAVVAGAAGFAAIAYFRSRHRALEEAAKKGDAKVVALLVNRYGYSADRLAAGKLAEILKGEQARQARRDRHLFSLARLTLVLGFLLVLAWLAVMKSEASASDRPSDGVYECLAGTKKMTSCLLGKDGPDGTMVRFTEGSGASQQTFKGPVTATGKGCFRAPLTLHYTAEGSDQEETGGALEKMCKMEGGAYLGSWEGRTPKGERVTRDFQMKPAGSGAVAGAGD